MPTFNLTNATPDQVRATEALQPTCTWVVRCDDLTVTILTDRLFIPPADEPAGLSHVTRPVTFRVAPGVSGLLLRRAVDGGLVCQWSGLPALTVPVSRWRYDQGKLDEDDMTEFVCRHMEVIDRDEWARRCPRPFWSK